MDLATILIAALVQLSLEYAAAQPLSGAARNIVSDKRRKEAFASAVRAAYRDLQESAYRELSNLFLDEYFLGKPEVTRELLKVILIADQPNFDELQAIYTSSGLGVHSPDARPALVFLVERILQHSADRNEWFRDRYRLILAKRQTDSTEKIKNLLEGRATAQNENERNQNLDLIPPPAKCRQLWGRESFVGDMLSHLETPKSPPILYLSGGPGYGKTEAAREIAARALLEKMFEGVLWITAKSTEFVAGEITGQLRAGSLSRDEFINALATKLACPRSEVGTILRQQKLLIVLDNAETADTRTILAELLILLNPSRAILTSREDLHTPFLETIEVPGLESKPSYMLLRDEASFYHISELVEAQDQDLEPVHTLTCGAPLALHFVVGRVLNDHSLSPVISDLGQANKHVEEFYRFCLADAWLRIDDTAKFILRFIGHWADSSVSRNTLLAVGNISESDINASLATLERWHLLQVVTRSPTPVRYDLHPWVRNSIRSHLVDNWQPSAQNLERVLQYRKNQILKWKSH